MGKPHFVQGNIELAYISVYPCIGAGRTWCGTGGNDRGEILINGNVKGVLPDAAP